MNKKDSLNFLQSCIDRIANASEEDIERYRMKYDMHCMKLMITYKLEYISPTDLESQKEESVEEIKMTISESSMLGTRSKIKMDYYFVGLSIKNSQENGNAAFAA